MMTQKMKCMIRAILLCLLMGMCVLATACQNDDKPTDASSTAAGDEKATYTIEVRSEGGMALTELGIYVYEDSTKAELITFARTDGEGKISFTDVVSDKYVAVLDGVPDGYSVEESYLLTGENTRIVLPTGVISDTNLTGVSYKTGDVIRDFTVTTPDGAKYTLSEVLAEKEAVVLNFWYTKCEPCKMEFPYLQEAYEKYSDKLEIIAINPVEADDDAIAAFKSDLGITFPMAQGDPAWEEALNALYPTTVVIDRYGVITMIHKGTVPNAETFENVFEHFTAENYEQKLFDGMGEFEVSGSEGNTETTGPVAGTAENPIELGGISEFEAEVKAGETVYYHLYRVNDMIFTLEDNDAYVVYGGETLKPVDGVITFVLTTEDMNTPAAITIGNSGKTDKTFKVTLSVKEGTFNNPYPLKMGEFTTDIEAGNEQGVYYSYTAMKDGTVTIKNISVTEDVVHGYVLYNLNTYAQRTLGEDGENTVSIEVNEGDELMVTVAVLPDEENEYPAATIRSVVSFQEKEESGSTEDDANQPTEGNTEKPTAGNTEGTTENTKLTYTIKVTDTNGAAISNVSLTVNGKSLKTNASGIATVELEAGTYSVKLTVPSGYTASQTAYQVTESQTMLTIRLEKKSSEPTTDVPITSEKVNYNVTVVDGAGNPQTGITVNFMKSGSQVASQAVNASGVASATLDAGIYTVELSGSSLYYDEAGAVLSESKTSVKIVVATQTSGKSVSSTDDVYADKAVQIDVGTTYVELIPGATNYFIFGALQAGKYRFSVSNSDVAIGSCGTTSYVLGQISTTDVVNNVLTLSVKQSYITNNGAPHVIGLNVPSGVNGCVLQIAHVGEADMTIEDYPWNVYSAKTTPTKFTFTGDGSKLTYVDLSSSSTAVYNEVDGYYHLNSADGPILYVNLGAKAQYISYQTLLDSAPVRKYFYENGVFIKKEEYTDCMKIYVSCIDNNYGVYPLTEDLIYIIQNHGETSGWWDVGSQTYLFDSVANLNTNTAWMFACCYIP